MFLFHEAILQDPVFVQELSTSPLSQFLIENEGKRCVVVLDVSQRSATCPKKPKENGLIHEFAGDREGRGT
jgi:hypothetical protein